MPGPGRNTGSAKLPGQSPAARIELLRYDGASDTVRDYVTGSSSDTLAAQAGVNRTRITTHPDRRSIERRKSVRKTTDRAVREAATRYKSGDWLRIVAADFGGSTVDEMRVGQ